VRVILLKKYFSSATSPSLAHPAKSLIWQGTRALPPSRGGRKKCGKLSFSLSLDGTYIFSLALEGRALHLFSLSLDGTYIFPLSLEGRALHLFSLALEGRGLG